MMRLLHEASADRAGPGLALAEDVEQIVRAARDMASRFRSGGTLLAFGAGGAAADAGHLAVEFTHPVIVGKRALPAISLADDAAALSGLARAGGLAHAFATQVGLLGRPGDIAVGILADGDEGRAYGGPEDRSAGYGNAEEHGVCEGLRAAHGSHLLTIALTQEGVGVRPPVDHVLTARSEAPLIAREIHTTMYHVLWELVHVFLDHPEALDTLGGPGESCVTCSDTAVPVRVTELRPGGLALADTGAGIEEISVAAVAARVGDVVLVHAKEALAVLRSGTTGTMACANPTSAGDDQIMTDSTAETRYPFLRTGRAHIGSLLPELIRSTADKARESTALRRSSLDRFGPALLDCAAAMAAAFRGGGRMFSLGNGGSSTDAQALAQLFLAPGRAGDDLPTAAQPTVPLPAVPLPAVSLTADAALLTALGNDVGFEVTFARRLAALGASGDIAVALSTSGSSPNVLHGLVEARRLGMVTVGFAGAGGGRMAQSGLVDHLFVVPSSSVHRVQEAQTTLCHVLWELVQRSLAETA